jgi:two-component system cell cycle sensor histidine kinase/response regulator CckA
MNKIKDKQNSTPSDEDRNLLLENIRNTYSQFEDKLAELSILRELGIALLYINDFKRVCQTILEIIIKHTVAKNCSIMLMDHGRNQLFLIAATNQDGESYIIDAKRILSKDDVKYTFVSGEGAAGKAVAKKEPVLIKNVNESNIYTLRSDTKVKIGTLLSVPLIVEDTVLGVLTLSHPAREAFETSEVNLFTIVASFVALAISSTLNYQRLQYSEEKHRALTQYSNDGITIIQDNMHQYANPSYESLTGYNFNELRRITFNNVIFPQSDATNKARHDILHNRDFPGTYEAVMTSKNGNKTEIEISHAPFMYDGRPAEIISVRDLSKRKELENQLQQAQKMEAIGMLGGGMAHDFNNLLTGIQGNASLMLMDMVSTHPHYERLKNIEKQVQSGARLTSHLLGYARKGRYEVKPIDLNRLLEETSETFNRTRKEVTIRRELTKDLSVIEADPGQIEQVLLNLFVNAADAMAGGGELILKTINTTHKEMKGKIYDPNPGDYVLLTVIDTGMGMEKETIECIFDPFFTTKEIGRGTGLGLASAYGIIKSHRGYIDVQSKKGEGTKFSIYLPASEKKIKEPVKASEQVVQGTGTVLLVDDEEMVMEVGRDMLEAIGYSVLIARDGKEAIEVYRKNWHSIDIVLLDMVMPNISGSEAYDRMKEINPDIKVLLSSGYSIDGQANEILKRGCNGFIQKPFNINEFSGKIRVILKNK